MNTTHIDTATNSGRLHHHTTKHVSGYNIQTNYYVRSTSSGYLPVLCGLLWLGGIFLVIVEELIIYLSPSSFHNIDTIGSTIILVY